MTNMIRSAKDQAVQLTQAAYERAAAAGALPAGAQVKAAVEMSKDAARGDCASSFALAGAGALHMAPRAVAQIIADHLKLEGSYFSRAEIAGPGFLNFTLGPKWYGEVLSAIETQGSAYGSGDEGAGQRAVVEVVSAASMPLDAARAAALKDALANILSREGWEVEKERGVHGDRRFVVALTQPARLLREGRPVDLSRGADGAGLPDEIGADAARYCLTARPPSGPLDVDLDLAVRQDSGNPVYRVRYAHARICAILSRMAERGEQVCAAENVDAGLLTAPEERALMKALARYPEELRLAARDRDPSRVNRYLTDLAGDFRRFYNSCRCTADDPGLRAARLKLADSVRSVLANGLNLLGVTAPEKM